MLQRGLHGGKGLKIIDVIAIKRYNLNIIMLYHLWRFIMQIKPSAAIRQNYNEIADMCRKSAEPVFLTKNGEGDLVVMDIETYNKREKMLQLREELLAVEEDKMAGRTGCSIDELESYLDDIIERA